eukprot:CAMPEP_0204578052 /NCGR_PEP_ID=MMETSP0661-20131031/42702_1 /ASSEMBLY_ACC=CAM_ASM_000606 /TAXON_ID=109239 /ORGANISM="Alexandrium margalefi, Strain AMGDE01CS-322" /LENGTH=42 /DNA_ID= /DNA_START= /DNA_END= /DNA_ORIENTATION=
MWATLAHDGKLRFSSFLFRRLRNAGLIATDMMPTMMMRLFLA